MSCTCHHHDCDYDERRISAGASSTIVNGCGNTVVDRKALERIATALEDIASALKRR